MWCAAAALLKNTSRSRQRNGAPSFSGNVDGASFVHAAANCKFLAVFMFTNIPTVFASRSCRGNGVHENEKTAV
jgi:hypothetical protein